MNCHTCTKKEELVNAITHGIGAVLSIIALLIVIDDGHTNLNLGQFVSITVYAITMLMMYIFSTIMHSVPKGRIKDIFHALDHSSIFLYIAGTYTAISLLVVKGKLGMLVLVIVWILSLAGIVFKLLFLKKFKVLTTCIYLSFGSFLLILWEPLVLGMAYQGLVLLILGGLCYAVGTIFFLWKDLPYNHGIWHVFVLFGSAMHFMTFFQYVI
ncbi:PAQR family membrane homeostasis protein TrhA [Paraliobacillus sediminis]|uniref:PAQR family membrane homeostasis protein TrhA n=1 Tax=Paraliobacillus sediminis TaxID=1885916 RepID=UPI000E3D12F8|nr:hemolysin III family protein [Paraliobacillus sediminis]